MNNLKATIILMLFCTKANAQTDKLAHFSTGAAITGAGYCLTYCLTKNENKSMLVGCGLSVFAAVGKEIYDYKKYNSPRSESLKDIGFTCLGSGLACLSLRVTF